MSGIGSHVVGIGLAKFLRLPPELTFVVRVNRTSSPQMLVFDSDPLQLQATLDHTMLVEAGSFILGPQWLAASAPSSLWPEEGRFYWVGSNEVWVYHDGNWYTHA